MSSTSDLNLFVGCKSVELCDLPSLLIYVKWDATDSVEIQKLTVKHYLAMNASMIVHHCRGNTL